MDTFFFFFLFINDMRNITLIKLLLLRLYEEKWWRTKYKPNNMHKYYTMMFRVESESLSGKISSILPLISFLYHVRLKRQHVQSYEKTLLVFIAPYDLFMWLPCVPDLLNFFIIVTSNLIVRLFWTSQKVVKDVSCKLSSSRTVWPFSVAYLVYLSL